MKASTAPRPQAGRRLGLEEVLRLLVEDGEISEASAAELRKQRTRSANSAHPLVFIGEQRLPSAQQPKRVLSTEMLTEWLAGRTGFPYFHIDPLKIDVSKVCGVVSHAYATRFHILPVAVSDTAVTIATAEPFDREWQSVLEQGLRLNIRPVIANPADIVRYLAEFYSLARSVQSAMKSPQSLPSAITNFEQLVKLGGKHGVDANDRAIVHIVDWLLQYAFEQRASDIHIEPRRDECLVRFRIDGALHLVYQGPMTVMVAAINRIKLLARMDVVEKRRPQDGRIKTGTPNGEEIELRLSSMPTAFGEKLVMRIFDPNVLLKSRAELGFSDEENRLWSGLVHRPHGIVLVTGPTGSGKTTTLYSTLRELATPEVNVCTIEDPIEMVYPYLNQMQVQPNLGIDFALGVRTLMRQDPDVIMVGEIRDLETAEMAVQAALTGHLVLSTLHTNDAPAAVVRLMDLGVPPYLIRSTVLGVVAQRLVRTVCPHCAEPEPVDAAAWEALVRPWSVAMPAQSMRGAGCLECRMTGFRGRTGLYEMLMLSPELALHVDSPLDLDAMRAQAIREGMRPLRIAGALKVAAGLTTIDEVARNTPPVGRG
ncbi:MAG TPA: ATPase, T2SS/T4P/T4SS family [Plasticicumulans sp.]|nr:ATPase, T2SS/T4P/T4SS family [Plasticicumulans sp.]